MAMTSSPPASKTQKSLVSLAIILATLATYWQVIDYGFTNFDDTLYVTENIAVQQGLTLENIGWAFSTNVEDSYWHPLTWLSHMLDVQLFGLNPGPHHLVNLLIHIANSLLVFTILIQLTGRLWNSAFVALLFALHPINVESVVWIAERKNVLSTFFWLLTMLTYVRFTSRQTLFSYLITLLVFGLGVLTKPMLVTLPFTLLLLDFWPLNRLVLGQQRGEKSQSKIIPTTPMRLIIEKAPFMLLALTVAFIVSSTTKTISVELVPMDLRLANAVASYWHYLAKMVMPLDLAVYYPYPSAIEIWPTVATGLWLLCVTTLTLRAYKTKPHLTMGWLWFLGTLVPVLGLIQAGFWPAWADRWGYVPLIGLYIMISWGVTDLIIPDRRYKKSIMAFTAIIILTVLMATSRHQTQYWANDITLYGHAIDVGSGHPLIYNNLGSALEESDRTYEAIFYYRAALQHSGAYYLEAHNNLGVALTKLDRLGEAKDHLREAMRVAPSNKTVKQNMDILLDKQKNVTEEINQYTAALALAPNSLALYNKLAMAYAKSGQIEEAVQCYATAIEKDPGDKATYNNLGIILLGQGYTKEAITIFEKALKIDPEYVLARNNLAIALKKTVGEATF